MSYWAPYHVLDADVIIVGAGIAGLSTANALLEKDPSLNIMILEATARTGGRITSEPLLIQSGETQPFDLGGQWLSSQQEEIVGFIHKFCLKIERREHAGKQIINYEGRLYRPNSGNPFAFCGLTAKLELAKFIALVENLCKVKKLSSKIAPLNMQTFLDQNLSYKVNKAIMRMIILINCGVEPTEITVDFYIFFCISTHGIANQLMMFDKIGFHEFWIQGGTQELSNKITTLLDRDFFLLNNTQVLKITSTRRDVEIISNNGGIFYSSQVVIAIPPSEILKIQFTPALPEPQWQAFHNSVCGRLSKFVVTYKEAFWNKNNLSGDVYNLDEHNTNCPLVCCFNVSTKNSPAISGYFVNSGENPEFLILQQLARYFGDKQALNPLQFEMKHWQNGSPMCCYKSFADICQSQATNERMSFVGAETSIEWYGSIAGAILSANRVAIQVIYDERPASLTVDDMRLLQPRLSTLKKRCKNYVSSYKKVVSPYYQAATVVLVAALVILWRKGKFDGLKSVLARGKSSTL